MKMKGILVLISLMLFPIAVHSQDYNEMDKKRRMDYDRRMKKTPNSLSEAKGKPDNSTSEGSSGTSTYRNVFKEDTMKYSFVSHKFPDISKFISKSYLTVVNKNGQWVGIGEPLTEKQMSKAQVYYRLSKPNPEAPFIYMQVFNSLGQLSTNHSWGPYMANPFGSDEGIQYSWKAKLEDICQFEKIFHNGTLVQENMYNTSGELVLQYNLAYASENHIIGHYTDANGVFALLRKDEKCKYVSVKLDNNGFTSQVAFIDENGRLRRNGDNAFMQCFKKYENGLAEYTYSGDALGNPMIDSWGNCGWHQTYFANGKVKTQSCVDASFNPRRMPHKRNTTDVYNIKYKYDKWGNLIEGRYYNDKWEPDTATGGIHSYRITYRNGLRTSYATYGLNGKLVNYDDDIAMWVNEFDRNGNLLMSKKLNKDSLFSSHENCLTIRKYRNEKCLLSLNYRSTNGKDTILTLKRFSHAGGDSVYAYKEGYINIYNYNLKGNIDFDAYYDYNMQPIDNIGYHRIAYTDTGTRYEEVYLDKNGNPADLNGKNYWRDYNRSVTEIDSLAFIKIKSTYDGNRLIQRFGNRYDNGFNYTNELFYYDSLGCRGRTFKADALYYKAIPTRSAIDGNVIMWSGLNEFGEPSYIMNGDWESASIYCSNVIDDNYYFDENGDTIPNEKKQRLEFKENLYKSFCIELVDSAAYKLGLRTGDIIIRYGNWQYPIPSQSGGYWENMLCYESVLQATAEKQIVVMRHFPETFTSKLLQFTLPEGSPHEIGFVYHMLYMTNAEYNRYNRVVSENRTQVELDSTNTEYALNYKLRFIKPCKVGNYSDKILFQEGFQENAILLGYAPYINGKEIFFAANNQYLDCNNAFETDYDSMAVYYTIDGVNAKCRVFGRDGYKDGDFRYYFRRSQTDVPNSRIAATLIDSLQTEYNTNYPTYTTSLSPRKAAEELLKLPGTTIQHSDSSRFRGFEEGKYGNVEEEYFVKVNLDSLTLQEKIRFRDIMQAVDFSEYVRLDSENDYLYTMIKDGKPNGTVWRTSRGIMFLTGNLTLTGTLLPTIKNVDDGILKEYGIDGEYVLLQYNSWRFGMNYEVLNKERTARRNGKAELRMAIARINYDGENVSLGKIETYEFGKGVLGAFMEWKECPQSIIDEVLARMKKIQKLKTK